VRSCAVDTGAPGSSQSVLRLNCAAGAPSVRLSDSTQTPAGASVPSLQAPAGSLHVITINF